MSTPKWNGWLGHKGHERARPYDPASTDAYNDLIRLREKGVEPSVHAVRNGRYGPSASARPER